MSYYVTTPIYYVNASPHLGHAYTTICADVVTRFQRLMGQETFFQTGTDEHGSNIARAAEEAGIPVEQFVDENAQRFRDLLPLLGCEPDFFIRTTDQPHRAFVQRIWEKLRENGDIYKSTYSGPYCEPCEAYYNEDDLLEGRLCPTHKRPVKDMEESNWFFPLSKYQDRLRDHFLANPEWVRPRVRYNEALSFIEGGLQDISISRSSITWGVPVPFDPEQVTYVWIDALFNYYSGLTYGSEAGDVSATFWPPRVQIMAKDILKFHAVIWPALLMATGFELPTELFIHGYLTMGGDKMSKTQGNVFDPFPVIEQHGPDPVRFYVLREVQFGQDGGVSLEGFEQRYTTELANELGNLVSRTAAMLLKYCPDGKVPQSSESSDIAQATKAAYDGWREGMDTLKLTPALDAVWILVRRLNQHVEQRAPWALAKDETQTQLLHETLGELVEGIVQVAWMLSPVTPGTSVRILKTFGLRMEDLAPLSSAWTWGTSTGRDVTRPEPLFPRLEPATS